MSESVDMAANRATTTTAAPSSKSFTHSSSSSSVPMSSPLLSATFRPFYPRAYPHRYYPNGDLQASPQLSDEANASYSHVSSWSHVNDDSLYDQLYYSSAGAEPYEASWMPSDGSMWDSSAWPQHWCGLTQYTYAEDDAVDSAVCDSDFMSYYAGYHHSVQDRSACASSNAVSAPSAPLPDENTQLLSCNVNQVRKADLGNCITERAPVPKVHDRVNLREQFNCALNKVKESSLSSSMESGENKMSGHGHNLASDEGKEVGSPFMDRKLDLNLSASQFITKAASGFGTRAGELKSTTDFIEHVQAQGESNSLKNALSNLESGNISVDITNTKHHVPLTSITSEDSHNSDVKSSTISLVDDKCEKAQSNKGVSDRTDTWPSNNHCETIASPKPAIWKVLEQMKDSEKFGQSYKNSSLQHDVLHSNGPRELVNSIHSLSKVLLSSQSKSSMIALDSRDCLLLENAICMLSHRLLQCSTIESDSYHDPNSQSHAAETEPNISKDSSKAFAESACLQNTSSQISSLKQILNFVSNFQHEIFQGMPRSTSNSSVGVNQSLNLAKVGEGLQKELRVLIGELQKLQEEVGYERSESNVTVSMYKDLWSEAQDALNIFRAEVQELRGELAVVKQELTNLKLAGTIAQSVIKKADNGMTVKATKDPSKTPCHGVILSDSPEESIDDNIKNGSCEQLQEGSNVLAEYFDAGSLHNHSSSCIPSVNARVANAKLINLPSSSGGVSKPIVKRSSDDAFGACASLENDVTQRLSLLLSRKDLDLNKSWADNSMEMASGSQVLESPSEGLGEDKTILPNEKFLACSETSCHVNGNNGHGVCHQMPAFRPAVSMHDSIERECSNAGSDAITELVSICEEEDIEVICFKPGASDSNFTYLTLGPEWEDVVVTDGGSHRMT